MWSNKTHQTGFTMVETLLVVGIFTILIGLSSIGLSRLIPNTISQASEATLLADLRQQQLKAQLGVGGVAHGIVFGTGEYVLFTGASYSPSEPSNRVVVLEDELTLASTLPSNTLIFAPLSGEPTALAPFEDQIILTNNEANTIMTWEVNELGVPLVVD